MGSIAPCNGSTGQAWDVITAGKHNNVPGAILIVNTLTQACMNFDPRRAAGDQAIMFSCGGRADGAGPLSLSPENQPGTCFTVKGAVIDVANCDSTDPNQSFTFGGSEASSTASSGSAPTSSSSAAASSVAPSSSVGDSEAETSGSSGSNAASSIVPDCGGQPSVTVTVTVTEDDTGAVAAPTASSSAATTTEAPTASEAVSTPASVVASTTTSVAAASQAATTDAPGTSGVLDFNPTTPVPVSRAGGELQPSAAAQSQQFDTTATRAFTGVSLKASNGQCLFINPTAGDFRENLIPVDLVDCTGSENEKFDFITQGAHNNAQNSTLIVSSLMNGCLNFDPRRAAGDTVIMFSCGGRADGDSTTTNSQLFPFDAAVNTNSITLAPENGNGQVCLVPNNGKLDQTTCDGGADQQFTIVQ
ncbi:hypothetical protein DH86_00001219 [Scytalidium sp. 3C]|nr:hypothetical protein DH86_00001219 [Scytalidium sp. 3C]